MGLKGHHQSPGKQVVEKGRNGRSKTESRVNGYGQSTLDVYIEMS